VAIVTGGSRGIGRAIAVELGRAGFDVAVNYAANAEAANRTVNLVEDAGGHGLAIRADIGNAADRDRLVAQTIEELGDIDFLVNNAGIAPRVRADLLETAEESFDDVLATNLKGPFFLTQLVARHMIDRRGDYDPTVAPAIVNISSISAYTASINRGEYCISKAGVAMMTQLFAARLARHGIHVYEIRPGVIETDMTGPVKAKYDQLIFEKDLLPIPRWGQPSDVARAVIAIAQGHLPYSTGQVIDVDGGFHMRRL
jgi:NAD(P)-dependent dehydrogenase (short-subunit alcohol dehydrogenase family)